MKLREIVDELDLQIKVKTGKLDCEVKKGYVSDLLSDVLANGNEGDLWVTLQTHQNIVAVAALKELSAIVIANGREPEEKTIQKAEAEGVLIMVSKMPAFEIIGKLYGLGICGTRSAVAAS